MMNTRTRPATKSPRKSERPHAAPCTQDRVSHTPAQPPATAEELRRASDMAGILMALRSTPRPVGPG